MCQINESTFIVATDLVVKLESPTESPGGLLKYCAGLYLQPASLIFISDESPGDLGSAGLWGATP